MRPPLIFLNLAGSFPAAGSCKTVRRPVSMLIESMLRAPTEERIGRTPGKGKMDLAANPLVTDLYQLNMMEAYLAHGETAPAVFEFFVRRLPSERGFLVAAGLEQVLAFLENLRFSQDDLGWLAATGRFTKRLLDYLAGLRFTGDVHAMPEGTLFFANEPILRITAPLPLAQLVETRVMNLLHFETLIASKAARMVLAADGRLLIDFGLRRAHGAEAGVLAARASYLVGFAGTATVEAERLFGIPTFGTMAHSFIEAHDDEATAFEHFAQARPEGLTLLLDTYDTEAAARKVVALAPRLQEAGITIRSVRLDSGDLAGLARSVRRILDRGALPRVGILASGGLDEYAIASLVAAKAPIAGFGVGTSLTTSSDVPALDCVYKLQDYAGVPRKKLSPGKTTWPGRKQVWRRHAADGSIAGDVISTAADEQPGTPLIEAVMAGGRRLAPGPTLHEIRTPRGKRAPASARGASPSRARQGLPGADRPGPGGARRRDRPAACGGRGGERVSERIMPTARDVLLVVDVQNDFCPGGALAVPRGDEVVPLVNRLAQNFRHVVLTQDWHPAGHRSFASTYPGLRPYDTIELPYGRQILWPDHCIQGTPGAEFRSDLDIPHAQLIIRKGYDADIDSYSALFENDHHTPTGLVGYLRERGLSRIFLAGLAYDFCVRYSAEDAFAQGFEVIVVEDACRGIDVAGSIGDTRRILGELGISSVATGDFADRIRSPRPVSAGKAFVSAGPNRPGTV